MLGLRVFASVLLAATAAHAASASFEAVDAVDSGGMTTIEEIEEALAELLASTPTPTPTPTYTTTPVSTETETPSPTPSQTFQTSRCLLAETNAKRMDIDCASERLRFIGLGDWGETSDTVGVLAVRDGLLKAAATGNYDFVLAVGDNFYNNGVANTTDSIWRSLWYDRYEIGSGLTLPWVALLGNHDWYGNASAQIEYGYVNEAGSRFWMMPSKEYVIHYKNAASEVLKMVVVDTNYLNETGIAWAKSEYANEDGEAALVLAVGHHHIYSAGGAGDNSTAAMVELNEVLQSSPARAYIAGHEHDMQYLRAGGVDYFQIGGGGRTVDTTAVAPGTSANEVVFYERRYGFALFNVDLASRSMAVTYHVYNTSGVHVDEVTFTRQY